MKNLQFLLFVSVVRGWRISICKNRTVKNWGHRIWLRSDDIDVRVKYFIAFVACLSNYLKSFLIRTYRLQPVRGARRRSSSESPCSPTQASSHAIITRAVIAASLNGKRATVKKAVWKHKNKNSIISSPRPWWMSKVSNISINIKCCLTIPLYTGSYWPGTILWASCPFQRLPALIHRIHRFFQCELNEIEINF